MPTFRPCPPVAPGIVTAAALRERPLTAISAAAVTIPGATGGHGLKVGSILRLSYQCLYIVSDYPKTIREMIIKNRLGHFYASGPYTLIGNDLH